MHAVLQQLDDSAFVETLPSDLLVRQRLINRADALRRIHFPVDDATLADYERARSPAHLRLIFEALFWVGFAISLRKGERQHEPKGSLVDVDDRVGQSL